LIFEGWSEAVILQGRWQEHHSRLLQEPSVV